jgi:hypothetical protein
MRGCLFTLVLAVAVIAFIVVVGLPALAAGALTDGVRAAGLDAADITVTVSSDPPTDLLGLHADRVRVRATHATFRGLAIGSLDVTLSDVAVADRTFGAVAGTLRDVTVPDIGGKPTDLAAVTLAGADGAITASTIIPAARAQGLLADGIASAIGIRPTSVEFGAPDRVTARLGVLTVTGRLGVDPAGDVIATIANGPLQGQQVVLLAAGGGLPIHVTSASVTASGDVRLDGALTVGLLG